MPWTDWKWWRRDEPTLGDLLDLLTVHVANAKRAETLARQRELL